MGNEGKGFDIDSAFENFDISFGDDGELEVFSLGEDEDTEDLVGDEEDAGDGGAEGDEGGDEDAVESGGDAGSQADSQISALEEKIAQLEARLQNAGNEDQEYEEEVVEEDESLFDDDTDLVELFSDNKRAGQVFKDAVERAVQQRMKPMQGMVAEYQARVEVQDMFAKYGDSFAEAIPQVREVIAERPELDLETAFSLVKKFGVKAPTQGSTEANPSSVAAGNDKRSAKRLIEKAERLKTEQGVSGSKESDNDDSTDIESAFAKALEQHGLA